MGILDSVTGALGGGMQGGGSGGVGKAALIQMVLQMLGNDSSTGGGLSGLISKFQSSGLGDIVNSWISNGPNKAISPDQLQSVLGSDLIGQVAAKLGISPQTASAELAESLPEVVDQMTPNGQVPEGGGFGEIGSLLGRFG